MGKGAVLLAAATTTLCSAGRLYIYGLVLERRSVRSANFNSSHHWQYQ
jgi:hypothetical protein